MRANSAAGLARHDLQVLGRERDRPGRRPRPSRATRMIAPWSRQLAPAMAARGRVGSSALDGARRPRRRRPASSVIRMALRGLVVLGLGQQVDRDAARVLRGVGEHHDLGRAGDAVDADPAEHLALGLGDIGVAGPDDAVHRRDAWRCPRPAPRPPARRRPGRSPPPRPAAPRPARAGSARRPGLGTHIAIRRTPATRAGIAFISTEDG